MTPNTKTGGPPWMPAADFPQRAQPLPFDFLRARCLLGAAIFLLGVGLLTGCANFVPPPFPGVKASHPLIFKRGFSWTQNLFPADLDKDGRDELIQVGFDPRLGTSNVVLFNSDRILIEQVNCNGTITCLRTLDWNGDGVDEIVHTFTQHDSAFLRIIDSQGNVLVSRAFLFSGHPRRDSTAVFAWQGNITEIALTDLDHDDRKEILIQASETMARAPRGIFLYDAKTLKLLRKYEFGPLVTDQPIIRDFNGDGKDEILIFTSSPANGNRANGTDDRHSYIFMLNNELRPIWYKQLTRQFSEVDGFVDDMEADGKTKIYVVIHQNKETKWENSLETLDPATGKRLAAVRILPANTLALLAVQWNHDLPKEFALLKHDGTVQILDTQFRILKETKIKGIPISFSRFPDIDNDGFEELFVNCEGEIFLLNHSLKTVVSAKLCASSPYGLFPQTPYIVHYLDRPLQLILWDTKPPSKSSIFSLQRNPYFLLQRYGPWGLLLVLVGLAVFVVLSLRRRLLAMQFLRNLNVRIGAISPSPVFLLDHLLNIRYANAAARNLLGERTLKKHLPLKAVAKMNPELFRIFSEIRFHGEERIERKVTFQSRSGAKYALLAEPVRHPAYKLPFWLVIFKDISQQMSLEDAQTWAAMAQRIAHDIKNPLTSIQLTLQRMQLYYRNRYPELSGELDSYVEKIIGRIQDLRRLSSDFMKLVHLEELNLCTTDLNRSIESFLANMEADIPPDIEIRTLFTPYLPSIIVDQEQLHSVLQNLISNAINAMPNGGTITIRTGLAKHVRFDGKTAPPMDYLILSVQDTGVGIPDGIRENLFRPFTTGSKRGTGLGLAIVKRILDQHDAHIKFQSERNVGTTFTIYFPLDKVKPGPQAFQQKNKEPKHRENDRIF